MSVIGIDYGHGGMVDGVYQTRGKFYTFVGPPPMTVYEGVINRQIAAQVMRMLREYDHSVVDVVSTYHMITQADVPIHARVKRANAYKVDCVISIHANASSNFSTGPGNTGRGFEIFHNPGSKRGQILAERVFSEMRATVKDLKPRRVADAAFQILRETNAPAILVECGFFDNIDDARYLMSQSGQSNIATGIADGVHAWTQTLSSRT